jgi:hypothetical protein
MGTKVNSNYEDLLTFTRASKGHALRPVSYGDELVTNGDFELGDNGDWGVNTNWTISGGVATLVGGDGVYANSGLYQLMDLDVGKIYKVSLDVSGLTGTFRIYHASYSTGTNIDSTGTLVFNIVGESGGTRLNILGNNGSAVTLDNISVKEVLFDQSDGTLTLFEHPENVPRVEYDTSNNRLGLLVEESRSNLIPYSDFSSGWAKASGDFQTPNSGIAPDGTNTAVQYEVNSSGFLYDAITVTASTEYTFSWYVKRASSQAATQGVYAFYDESNNAFIERTVYNIPSSGGIDGWHRQSHTFTTPAGCTSVRVYPLRADGSGGAVFKAIGRSLIWGAQLEAGSFPTSYIKTTGSTATRSADVASIPVADFGYNTKVGSVVAEYLPIKVTSDVSAVFEISSDSTDDRAYHSASTGNHWLVRSGNAVSANIDVGTVAEGANKVSGVYKKDDFAISLNGASVSTDTSGNVPTSITEINMGSLYNGYYLNGHIKSIKYYPRRLTNAQLQDLTS